MNRRAYLSASSIALLSSISGCLSLFDTEIQVVGLTVANETLEEQSLDLRVLDGEQEIQQNEVVVEPAEEDLIVAQRVDCEWGTEPKNFRLEARLRDGWETLDIPSEAESDCVAASIVIMNPDSFYLRVTPCEDLEPDDEQWLCSNFEDVIKL